MRPVHHTRSLRAALLLAALPACAASVGPGASGDASVDASADRPRTPSDADAGRDVPYFDTRVYDVYREDVCPGARPPPQRAYECDPWGQTGCEAAEGCYPFIEYPSVPCGAEVYRARCFPRGTAVQDAFCRGGECAPGLACFVTGAMNRCLQLCRLDGASPQCPRGRVCEPTDLPDFGACQ